MDAEERALLKAIIAHPDEDTPRLVFADWLQEHDQPERAEYIRLSIQLANLRYGDPNFEADEERILEERRPLIDRFYKKWHDEFAARLPANRDVVFLFDRGLIEQVNCSVTYFLKNAERLFREVPIRCFNPKSLTTFTTCNLTASPWYRRLDRIRIIRHHDALTLLEATLPNIHCFDFSQRFLHEGQTNPDRQWEDVAIRLATHSNLRAIPQIDVESVKQINLESCGIGDSGGRAFANSEHLNPDVLNLLGNGLSADVRQALRARYGPRVWLDPADRNGFPRRS